MISTSPMTNHFSPSAARRSKNNSPDLPSQAPAEVPSRRKKLVDARNPLRDLNGAAPSSDVSSSSSIEAPKGCLRFFLSHSSSSNRNKPPQSRSGTVPETPKSAPAPKLMKNPRFRKRPIACQDNQSFSISSQERDESVNELQSHEPGQVNLGNESASELGFEQQSRVKQVLEDDSKIKTPPLVPSLSPEIQTGSNAFPVMEMKQTCYGTSHLLSGVPDKRKCRPRGVLCVRAKGSIFDSSSVDEDTDIGKRSDFSPVLLPQEASVHWFSSPCNEVAEFEDSPSLCFSSDFSKKSSGSFATYSSMDTSSSMSNNSGLRLSRGQLDFQGFVNFESSSPIEMKSPRVLASKQGDNAQFLNSPLLSSGNIIQTPSSGSAADRHRLADLVTNNVDLSFRLNTPSNSIDMAHVQRVLDCRECWVSDTTVSAFKSRSSLSISWRDGLVGRIIEMDDDDLCRCFSDDEENFTAGLKPLIHTPEKITSEVKAEVLADDKEMPRARVQCAAMESMSFDGDRLMESSDSDWNLCYRNELFRA